MKKVLLNIFLIILIFYSFNFNRINNDKFEDLKNFKSCSITVSEFKKSYLEKEYNFYISDFNTEILNTSQIYCHLLIKDLVINEGSNLIIPIVGWSAYIYLLQIILFTLIIIFNKKIFSKVT